MNRPSRDLRNALLLTSELCGVTWSDAAAAVAVAELARFPEAAVIGALARCRAEVTGRLTLAHIIDRIDDGRPGANEAWAHVGTLDERRSAVTTDEALQAWGEVRELLREDEVAARMAFLEAYKRIVARNRAEGVPVKWTASLGHDAAGRNVALIEAVCVGRLNAAEVQPLLVPGAPPLTDPRLTKAAIPRLQTGKEAVRSALMAPAGQRTEVARQRFGSILAAMGNPEEMRRLQEDLERKAADEEKRRDVRARAAGDGR